MSDFIYSNTPGKSGEFIRSIQSIYHRDAPEVFEFHGTWGSLGVSRNMYEGFQVLESDLHIFVVVGGPVLNFTNNRFLTGDDPVAGTREIFKRYVNGKIQLDEDLSGPFVILSVNKEQGTVTCITDLMMFIPVYHYVNHDKLVLGTHVDMVAKAAGQQASIDHVSLADFVINNVITFPYTAYETIRQLEPAAIHQYKYKEKEIQATKPVAYWMPEEKQAFNNLQQAAAALREGTNAYVKRVTDGMDRVAQFISAGEDSRAVAGMLPEGLQREAYIFLKKMNREGKIGGKAASVYNMSFSPHIFSKTRYIDILSEASDLVGSGHQYIHSHSLGPHIIWELDRFSAVFGGFLSDTLLKGHHVKLIKGSGFFTFFPQIPSKGFSSVNRDDKIAKFLVPSSIHHAITERQNNHLKKINKIRPLSYEEWFNIWPLSMHKDMPNLHSNRRLFRSYEPFMCKEAVKISASVPAGWKLNRRLFQKAMHPYLKKSRWLIHSKGFMPFFPWWVNILPQFGIWIYRKIITLTGITQGNQEDLVDWEDLMKTPEWEKTIEHHVNNRIVSGHFLNIPPKEAIRGKELKPAQKVNLLQVMYLLRKNYVTDPD